MSSLQTVIPDSAPESLFDLCFRCLATHLETICVVNLQTSEKRLKEGLKLPNHICEKLIDFYQQSGGRLDDGFATIFDNAETTLLKKVRLSYASVTDRGLHILLSHNLTELELANCESITELSLPHINEFGDSLLSLVVGPSVNILTNPTQPNCIIRTPNLHRLTFRNLKAETSFFSSNVLPLPNLTHLDLSGCCDLGNLSYLSKLENLISLVLYNVRDLREKIGSICLLNKLRHLDISSTTEDNGPFLNPNQTLAFIVENLTSLTSLDISYTNLAGSVTNVEPETAHDSTAPRTDIPGLALRVNEPLEFLGLYGMDTVCRRHYIPAKKISGNADESQIMTATATYIDRPEYLESVLLDLCRLYNADRYANLSVPNICRALSMVLEAMDRHIRDKRVQASGSAALLEIVKKCGNSKLIPMKMRRKIVCTIFNSMTTNQDHDTTMYHCCLVLSRLSTNDLMFDYERVVDILSQLVLDNHHYLVQRIGTHMLSSILFYVDVRRKLILGELGVIKRMLALVEYRIRTKECGDALENAWGVIWIATDDTYLNCQRFLDMNGLEIFLRCLNAFPSEEDLFRNMMGVLGNVAEVESLRKSLMTSQFVTVFSDMLDCVSDDIELSYHSAGVLSHMASDGPDAWTISEPKREDVLKKIVSAIESWSLTTERVTDYRSFEPILRLVKVYDTPECQLWAVWALANLSNVNPNKYCPIIVAEGGIALLEEVVACEEPNPRIKELAAMVIKNCQKYV